MTSGQEARGVDLEPLAARITSEVMARVGRSWRWRLAVGAAAAAAAVVVAGELAGVLGR